MANPATVPSRRNMRAGECLLTSAWLGGGKEVWRDWRVHLFLFRAPFLVSFLSIFINLECFFCIFLENLAASGVSGPPWRVFGPPWAERCAKQEPNERKGGSLDPPRAPSWALFWDHFYNIFRRKMRVWNCCYFDPYFNESGFHFLMICDATWDVFWLNVVIGFSIRFWMYFGVVPVIPNHHFCNTFHAKSWFLKFGAVAKIRDYLMNMLSQILYI